MQNLDAKGLERPAIKALRSQPEDLLSLYDEVLFKCNEKRTTEGSEALKLVFSWLAFSKRPLTLQEVNHLVVLKFGKKILDLEEEITGKCARYER